MFFIDPPYTASEKQAGSRLYAHSNIAHTDLFDLAQQLKGDFLLTYDNAKEVRDLANSHGLDIEVVEMRGAQNETLEELLIGRCLDWARETEKQIEIH